VKTYNINLDSTKQFLEKLPNSIEAKSPKEAAEKYAKCSVKRHYPLNTGGEIVVQSNEFPYRSYIYDRDNN